MKIQVKSAFFRQEGIMAVLADGRIGNWFKAFDGHFVFKIKMGCICEKGWASDE